MSNLPSIARAADGALQVSGVLTLESVPLLLKQSQANFTEAKTQVVDLAGVERADSAGVALLVEWLRLAEQSGGALQFRNIPQQMWTIIEVSDLEDHLPLQQRESPLQ